MTTKFRTSHPMITVTSASRAIKLCYAGTRDDIGGIISIADTIGPSRPPRPIIESFGSRALRLDFDDEIDDSNGEPPTAEHMARILKFGARMLLLMRQDKKRLLIHCYAGACRSTAAALAIIAQENMFIETAAFPLQHVDPAAVAKASFTELLDACEGTPVPNILMVKFADSLLGFGGALVDVVKAQHMSPQPATCEGGLARVGSALVGAVQLGLISLDDCDEKGCDDGWIGIQHPLRPPGVNMSVVPCPTCNAKGTKPYQNKATSGVTTTTEGEK